VKVCPLDHLLLGTFVVSLLLGFLFDLDFPEPGSSLPRGQFLHGFPTAGLYVEFFGPVFPCAVPGQLSRLCPFEAYFFSNSVWNSSLDILNRGRFREASNSMGSR